ncbi:MAG: Bax inhibitor-1/YccA family protein [Alphaproteobacteria bacterium]|nr:Bax inhibitor-1/YccA family protein [Alphaproteobacteria bacterium]
MAFQMGERPFNAIEKMSDGIRAYFGKVYNYMAGGLALSGLVAYVVSHSPQVMSLFYQRTQDGGLTYSLLGWVAILSPLILVFMISSAIGHMRVAKAQGLFWLFSGLMGVSLSNIFFFYENVAIVQAFLVTAGAFAGLSLYGYTTRKSLAGWGSFLFMGLFGVILASIVNLFLGSSAVNFGISVLSVIIFVGLTAYDTQKLKAIYEGSFSEEQKNALAISGALSLYLDFINLFRVILYFMNDRR